MSLAQLGSDDLTRSFLSLVELGRSRISLRALAIVADRLQLPMSYFLDDGTSHSESLMELSLDQAELALRMGDAQRGLRLIDGVEVPERMRVRALWLRGAALNDLGRQREAGAMLSEALQLAQKRDDVYLVTRLSYELGRTLLKMGNHDEAEIHLNRALANLKGSLEDPALIGKVRSCMGHIFNARGDAAGASREYVRARGLFKSSDDSQALASLYARVAQAYVQKGDIATALRYSRLGMGALEARHNARAAAGELNDIATHFRETGRLEEATQAAGEALERASSSTAQDVEAAAHATLASVYLMQERFADAARAAEEVDRLASEADEASRVDAWLVLAALAERESATARADELYTNAVETLAKTGKRAKLADVTLTYSLVLRKRGETDKALEFALQAAQARQSPG
jgi:tetratricopeptide (TPR) repeat protein